MARALHGSGRRERTKGRRTVEGPVLGAIFVLCIVLWWPGADQPLLRQDDFIFMAGSAEIASGRWEGLLAPAILHVQPLYRLTRLYFDLHFPEQFAGMHVLALLAHLASTVLLFGLSRRWLAPVAAPLAVAALFGWHALGAEAMLIKSANSFALSLPFLLGGVWCLADPGASLGRRAGGGIACLAAVGLHSLGAAAGLPGVLAAYYLLGRPSSTGRPAADRAAWAACGAPFLAGVLLWLRFTAPAVDPAQTGHFGEPAAPARLWDAVSGSLRHCGFLVYRRAPGRLELAAAILALALVLRLLRREAASRWLLAALALAAGPVLAAMLARTSLGYQSSRYAYQSFAAVAVAGGCLVQLALRALEHRRAARLLVLAALVSAAPYYWLAQKQSHANRFALLQREAGAPAPAWPVWARFFDRLAASARASGTTVRLPWVEVYPGVATYELFTACNLRGEAGVTALPRGANHTRDCLDFWRRTGAALDEDPGFRTLRLPASLAIVPAGAAVPPGGHLVCRVADSLDGPRILVR